MGNPETDQIELTDATDAEHIEDAEAYRVEARLADGRPRILRVLYAEEATPDGEVVKKKKKRKRRKRKKKSEKGE